jgi:protein TonB
MLQFHLSRHASLLVTSAGLALSLMLCAAPAAAADQADTRPQIDLSRPNYQPRYPAAAQQAGERGTAVVAVYVNAIGNPYKVILAETSGFADLDRAAVDAVRTWHFVPARRNDASVSEWTAVGIRFDLSGVSQVPVSAETKIAESDRNRVICKADVNMTGSNIGSPSVCLPKWQWDRQETADQKTMMDATRRTGMASSRAVSN